MAKKRRSIKVGYRGRADIRKVGKKDGLSKDYVWEPKSGQYTVLMDEADAQKLLDIQLDDFCIVGK